MFRKVIASVLTFTFLVQSLGFSQIQPLELRAAQPVQIEIPKEFGEIVSSPFASSKSNFIIHIQDAHGSYEAQQNIEKIIRYLSEHYGIKTLFLEGGAGKLAPEQFHFFEDRKLDLKVADLMMKRGAFTGAEKFLLSSSLRGGPSGRRGNLDATGLLRRFTPRNDEVSGYGIEDISFYRDNFKLFESAVNAQPKADLELKKSKSEIQNQINRVFSKDARDFVKSWEFHQSGKSDWMRYLSVLDNAAGKHLAMDLRNPENQIDFPMLVRYFNLKNRNVAAGKSAGERKSFLEFLKGKISTELYEQISNFEESENPRQVFESLQEEISKKQIKLPEFPNFIRYAGNRMLQSEMKSKELFQEMNQLSNRILTKLVTTPEEKKILTNIREHILLEKLAHLELTREEWKQVPSREGLTAKQGDVLNPSFDFYRAAEKRESAFLKNIEVAAKQNKIKRAILITGGFHAEGFESKLKQLGYSFITIRPNFTDTENSRKNYLSAMLPETSQLVRALELNTSKTFEGLVTPRWSAVYHHERKVAVQEVFDGASLGTARAETTSRRGALLEILNQTEKPLSSHELYDVLKQREGYGTVNYHLVRVDIQRDNRLKFHEKLKIQKRDWKKTAKRRETLLAILNQSEKPITSRELYETLKRHEGYGRVKIYLVWFDIKKDERLKNHKKLVIEKRNTISREDVAERRATLLMILNQAKQPLTTGALYSHLKQWRNYKGVKFWAVESDVRHDERLKKHEKLIRKRRSTNKKIDAASLGKESEETKSGAKRDDELYRGQVKYSREELEEQLRFPDSDGYPDYKFRDRAIALQNIIQIMYRKALEQNGRSQDFADLEILEQWPGSVLYEHLKEAMRHAYANSIDSYLRRVRAAAASDPFVFEIRLYQDSDRNFVIDFIDNGMGDVKNIQTEEKKKEGGKYWGKEGKGNLYIEGQILFLRTNEIDGTRGPGKAETRLVNRSDLPGAIREIKIEPSLVLQHFDMTIHSLKNLFGPDFRKQFQKKSSAGYSRGASLGRSARQKMGLPKLDNFEQAQMLRQEKRFSEARGLIKKKTSDYPYSLVWFALKALLFEDLILFSREKTESNYHHFDAAIFNLRTAMLSPKADWNEPHLAEALAELLRTFHDREDRIDGIRDILDTRARDSASRASAAAKIVLRQAGIPPAGASLGQLSVEDIEKKIPVLFEQAGLDHRADFMTTGVGIHLATQPDITDLMDAMNLKHNLNAAILDLGHGQGELAIRMAAHINLLFPGNKIIIHGIEFDDSLYQESLKLLKAAEDSGLIPEGQVRFFQGDFNAPSFHSLFKDIDVIFYASLSTRDTKKLGRTLFENLTKRGARIVEHGSRKDLEDAFLSLGIPHSKMTDWENMRVYQLKSSAASLGAKQIEFMNPDMIDPKIRKALEGHFQSAKVYSPVERILVEKITGEDKTSSKIHIRFSFQDGTDWSLEENLDNSNFLSSIRTSFEKRNLKTVQAAPVFKKAGQRIMPWKKWMIALGLSVLVMTAGIFIKKYKGKEPIPQQQVVLPWGMRAPPLREDLRNHIFAYKNFRPTVIPPDYPVVFIPMTHLGLDKAQDVIQRLNQVSEGLNADPRTGQFPLLLLMEGDIDFDQLGRIRPMSQMPQVQEALSNRNILLEDIIKNPDVASILENGLMGYRRQVNDPQYQTMNQLGTGHETLQERINQIPAFPGDFMFQIYRWGIERHAFIVQEERSFPSWIVSWDVNRIRRLAFVQLSYNDLAGVDFYSDLEFRYSVEMVYLRNQSTWNQIDRWHQYFWNQVSRGGHQRPNYRIAVPIGASHLSTFDLTPTQVLQSQDSKDDRVEMMRRELEGRLSEQDRIAYAESFMIRFALVTESRDPISYISIRQAYDRLIQRMQERNLSSRDIIEKWGAKLFEYRTLNPQLNDDKVLEKKRTVLLDLLSEENLISPQDRQIFEARSLGARHLDKIYYLLGAAVIGLAACVTSNDRPSTSRQRTAPLAPETAPVVSARPAVERPAPREFRITDRSGPREQVHGWMKSNQISIDIYRFPKMAISYRTNRPRTIWVQFKNSLRQDLVQSPNGGDLRIELPNTQGQFQTIEIDLKRHLVHGIIDTEAVFEIILGDENANTVEINPIMYEAADGRSLGKASRMELVIALSEFKEKKDMRLAPPALQEIVFQHLDVARQELEQGRYAQCVAHLRAVSGNPEFRKTVSYLLEVELQKIARSIEALFLPKEFVDWMTLKKFNERREPEFDQFYPGLTLPELRDRIWRGIVQMRQAMVEWDHEISWVPGIGEGIKNDLKGPKAANPDVLGGMLREALHIRNFNFHLKRPTDWAKLIHHFALFSPEASKSENTVNPWADGKSLGDVDSEKTELVEKFRESLENRIIQSVILYRQIRWSAWLAAVIVIGSSWALTFPVFGPQPAFFAGGVVSMASILYLFTVSREQILQKIKSKKIRYHRELNDPRPWISFVKNKLLFVELAASRNKTMKFSKMEELHQDLIEALEREADTPEEKDYVWAYRGTLEDIFMTTIGWQRAEYGFNTDISQEDIREYIEFIREVIPGLKEKSNNDSEGKSLGRSQQDLEDQAKAYREMLHQSLRAVVLWEGWGFWQWYVWLFHWDQVEKARWKFSGNNLMAPRRWIGSAVVQLNMIENSLRGESSLVFSEVNRLHHQLLRTMERTHTDDEYGFSAAYQKIAYQIFWDIILAKHNPRIDLEGESEALIPVSDIQDYIYLVRRTIPGLATAEDRPGSISAASLGTQKIVIPGAVWVPVEIIKSYADDSQIERDIAAGFFRREFDGSLSAPVIRDPSILHPETIHGRSIHSEIDLTDPAQPFETRVIKGSGLQEAVNGIPYAFDYRKYMSVAQFLGGETERIADHAAKSAVEIRSAFDRAIEKKDPVVMLARDQYGIKEAPVLKPFYLLRPLKIPIVQNGSVVLVDAKTALQKAKIPEDRIKNQVIFVYDVPVNLRLNDEVSRFDKSFNTILAHYGNPQDYAQIIRKFAARLALANYLMHQLNGSFSVEIEDQGYGTSFISSLDLHNVTGAGYVVDLDTVDTEPSQAVQDQDEKLARDAIKYFAKKLNIPKEIGFEVYDQVRNAANPKKMEASSLGAVEDLVGGETNFDYLEHIRKRLNPARNENKKTTALYLASGADISTAILATDADNFIFVDQSPFNVDLGSHNGQTKENIIGDYLDNKKKTGFGLGAILRVMKLRAFLESELDHLTGKGNYKIKEDQEDERVYHITFEWKGRPRHLIFIGSTDIGSVKEYEKYMRESGGIDFLIRKSGEYTDNEQRRITTNPRVKAARQASAALTDTIAESWLKPGGFLILDSQHVQPSERVYEELLERVDDETMNRLEQMGARFGYTANEGMEGAYVFKKTAEASSLGKYVQEPPEQELGQEALSALMNLRFLVREGFILGIQKDFASMNEEVKRRFPEDSRALQSVYLDISAHLEKMKSAGTVRFDHLFSVWESLQDYLIQYEKFTTNITEQDDLDYFESVLAADREKIEKLFPLFELEIPDLGEEVAPIGLVDPRGHLYPITPEKGAFGNLNAPEKIRRLNNDGDFFSFVQRGWKILFLPVGLDFEELSVDAVMSVHFEASSLGNRSIDIPNAVWVPVQIAKNYAGRKQFEQDLASRFFQYGENGELRARVIRDSLVKHPPSIHQRAIFSDLTKSELANGRWTRVVKGAGLQRTFRGVPFRYAAKEVFPSRRFWGGDTAYFSAHAAYAAATIRDEFDTALEQGDKSVLMAQKKYHIQEAPVLKPLYLIKPLEIPVKTRKKIDWVDAKSALKKVDMPAKLIRDQVMFVYEVPLMFRVEEALETKQLRDLESPMSQKFRAAYGNPKNPKKILEQFSARLALANYLVHRRLKWSFSVKSGIKNDPHPFISAMSDMNVTLTGHVVDLDSVETKARSIEQIELQVVDHQEAIKLILHMAQELGIDFTAGFKAYEEVWYGASQSNNLKVFIGRLKNGDIKDSWLVAQALMFSKTTILKSKRKLKQTIWPRLYGASLGAKLEVARVYTNKIVFMPGVSNESLRSALKTLGLFNRKGVNVWDARADRFNRDLGAISKYLGISSGELTKAIPIILEDSVYRGESATKEIALKLSQAMREQDLLGIDWEGQKSPLISDLRRVANHRFEVKDVQRKTFTDAVLKQWVRRFDVAPIWIGSVGDENAVQISFSDGDKIKLNLEVLHQNGIDPTQVVALLRQIAAHPDRRQQLFDRAGFTKSADGWEVGQNFVSLLLNKIYADQTAQHTFQTAA